MATNIWKELPESGSGSGTITDINGSAGPSITIDAGSGIDVTTVGDTITITNLGTLPSGSPNTFAGFDGSGNLQTIPGFNIDTNSGGMNEGLTQHPDDGNGFTANSFSVLFEPLQNSPDENWNIQSIQAFLDSASSGFSQGTSGGAIQLLNLGLTHQGTGNVGGLNFVTLNSSLGNGTDPISIKSLNYIYGFSNINDNVTIDGSVGGYGFQPAISASAIGTSNFNASAFYDFPTILIPIHGYNSFNAGPTLVEIANNSNYNGLTISPNITTLTGNAGVYGFGFYPSIANMGADSPITVININPTIGTMGTNSGYNGILLGGGITTMGSNGNFTAISVNTNIATSDGNIQLVTLSPVITAGDAGFTGLQISPQGGATLTDPVGIRISMNSINSSNPQGMTGLESDSRIQINANTQLKAAQTFQIGSRLEHLFTVPLGSPVTGTDEITINIAGDLLAQDNIANGAFGIGFNSTGFISSMAIAATKTVDSVTVFLPAAAFPDPGFTTGGNVTDFHFIRILPPLPQGGTVNITDLYALKLDSGFGSFSGAATNAYGIYLDDNGIKNRLYGSAQYTTNTKVTSYTVDSGAIKDYVVLADSSGGVVTVTLPSPTPGRYLVIKDSGGAAGTNNITISPNAAETIDGAASLVMNVNYESATLISNGTNWFVL